MTEPSLPCLWRHLVRWVVCLLIVTLSSTSAIADDAALEAEAHDLVSRYLVAVAHGDTSAIKTLIGGELLETRRGLLDNPDYSAELIRTHQSRRLSITGVRVLGPDQAEVDLRIEESSDSQFSVQLLVARSTNGEGELRIVSEY